MTSILHAKLSATAVPVTGQSTLSYSDDGTTSGVLGDTLTDTFFHLLQTSSSPAHYTYVASYLPNPHSGLAWDVVDSAFDSDAHAIPGMRMGFSARLPVAYPIDSTGGFTMRLVYDPDENMAQTPVLWTTSWRLADTDFWVNDYIVKECEVGQGANLWTALDTGRCRMDVWSEVRDAGGDLVTFEQHFADANFEFPYGTYVVPPTPASILPDLVGDLGEGGRQFK